MLFGFFYRIGIIVYDNEDIVVEYFTTSAGTEKTFYTHGPGIDEPLELERSGSYYYFHADGLGSITHITNSDKTAVQSYTYDAYGMATASSDFRSSYQHTGREYDWETATLFMRERTKDLIDGNFLSKDPIGLAGGINLYQYTSSNPLNYIDPFGLDKMTDELKANAKGLEEPFFLADPINYVGAIAGTATKMIRGAIRQGSQCVAKAASQSTTKLYHGGKLKGGSVQARKFSTTTDKAHAQKYAKQYDGKIYEFEIPTARLYEMERQGLVKRGRDMLKGTQGNAPEWRFLGEGASELNLY